MMIYLKIDLVADAGRKKYYISFKHKNIYMIYHRHLNICMGMLARENREIVDVLKNIFFGRKLREWGVMR